MKKNHSILRNFVSDYSISRSHLQNDHWIILDSVLVLLFCLFQLKYLSFLYSFFTLYINTWNEVKINKENKSKVRKMKLSAYIIVSKTAPPNNTRQNLMLYLRPCSVNMKNRIITDNDFHIKITYILIFLHLWYPECRIPRLAYKERNRITFECSALVNFSTRAFWGYVGY